MRRIYLASAVAITIVGGIFITSTSGKLPGQYQVAAAGDTTTNLIAHYTLDGGSAADSAGSYNGTAKNSPGSGSGAISTAMTFSGTQVVEIPNIAALQNIPAITISVWVKGAGDFSASAASGYSVVSKIANGQLHSWSIGYGTANRTYNCFIGTTNNTYGQGIGTTILPTDTAWHLLTCTYDGSHVTMYTDGVASTPVAVQSGGNIAAGNDPICIGGYSDGASCYTSQVSSVEPWHGSLDDVQIFSRSLSSDDVKKLYCDVQTEAVFCGGTGLNTPPAVSTGGAQSIILPATASLTGTITDDGKPSGAALTYSWSKVSGAGSVTFSNQSGTVSSASSPNTTATISGATPAAGGDVYVLRLTASDTHFSSTADVNVRVFPAGTVANVPPVAVIAATPTTGNPPLDVSFSGTDSVDSDGTIASYIWTFGDGGNGSGSSVTHRYVVNGSYTATLTVTDNKDDIGSATKSIYVTSAAPDTSAPSVTNTMPKSSFEAGTTNVTVTFRTNETATCKYSASAGASFASMTNTATGAGTTNQSIYATGLANGTSYTYYIRCQDAVGNANSSDAIISFNVKNPATVAASFKVVNKSGNTLIELPTKALYSGYVNFRPGDGETVDIYPPRFSWRYRPQVFQEANNCQNTFPCTGWVPYKFVFQVDDNSDFSSPLVNVTTLSNAYNFVDDDLFHPGGTYYWRVGYIAPKNVLSSDLTDAVLKANGRGGAGAINTSAYTSTSIGWTLADDSWASSPYVWSQTRTFRVSSGATAWDRGMLADQSKIAVMLDRHPHILFSSVPGAANNRDSMYIWITDNAAAAWGDLKDSAEKLLDWRGWPDSDPTVPQFYAWEFDSTHTVENLISAIRARGIAVPAGAGLDYINNIILPDNNFGNTTLSTFAYTDVALTPAEVANYQYYLGILANVHNYPELKDPSGRMNAQRYISWINRKLLEVGDGAPVRDTTFRNIYDPGSPGQWAAYITRMLYVAELGKSAPAGSADRELSDRIRASKPGIALKLLGEAYVKNGATGICKDVSSDYSLATQSYALAYGYDWFNDDLTDAEKTTILKTLEASLKSAMFTDGIIYKAYDASASRCDYSDPETSYPWGKTVLSESIFMGGDSHAMSSIYSRIPVALSCYMDSDICKQYWEIAGNFMIGVTYPFSPDGAPNAGSGYTMGHLTPVNESGGAIRGYMVADLALPNAQLSKNPFWKEAVKYFDKFSPAGYHTWGDQWTDYGGTDHGLAAMLGGVWLARYTKDPVYATHVRTDIARFSSVLGMDEANQSDGRNFEWFPLMKAFPKVTTVAQTANKNSVYPVDGYAFGCSYPQSSLDCFQKGVGFTFVAKPRGIGRGGHAAYSDLSFDIWAYGSNVTAGSGTSESTQTDVPWIYHPMQRNSLLVDGLGEHPPTVANQPYFNRIFACQGAEGCAPAKGNYVYVAADGTNAYPIAPDIQLDYGYGFYMDFDHGLAHYKNSPLAGLEKVRRHILFVKNKYFVIYDDLASSKPVTFTWLYHILKPGFDLNTYLNDDLDLNESDGSFTYKSNVQKVILDFERYSNTFPYGSPYYAFWRAARNFVWTTQERAAMVVPDVNVFVKHIEDPASLTIDNRTGRNRQINPFTGEQFNDPTAGGFREDMKYGTEAYLPAGQDLRTNALWFNSKHKQTRYHFMTVIYPKNPAEAALPDPQIIRLDDYTAKVINPDGTEDIISFNLESATTTSTTGENILVDIDDLDPLPVSDGGYGETQTVNSYTLSVAQRGNGKVISSPSGIDCGVLSCSVTLTSPAAYTLTAIPINGGTFSGWSGACSGNNSTCSVTVNSNKSVTATFVGGATTLTDTTPPTIPSVSSGPITSTSATVSWSLSENAETRIQYGLTSGVYGSWSASTSPSARSFTFSGLLPNTTYHYRLIASDSSGNTSAFSEDHTFTTSVAATKDDGSSSKGGRRTSGGGGGYTPPPQTPTSTPILTRTASSTSCYTIAVPASAHIFTRTLQIGSTGNDVKELQKFLNSHGYRIAATGNGSPGKETTYFGPATKVALVKYQAVKKIAPASGILGPLTRTRVNAENTTPSATKTICQTPTPTPGTSAPTISATSTTYIFTRTLQIGSTGNDVKELQKFLNSHGYRIAATGNGSPGKETTYFGPATVTALTKYQRAMGITPASGIFGPLTRAHVVQQMNL